MTEGLHEGEGIIADARGPFALIYHPEGGALAFKWEQGSRLIDICAWSIPEERIQYEIGITLDTEGCPFSREVFMKCCNTFLGIPDTTRDIEALARVLHKTDPYSVIEWEALDADGQESYRQRASSVVEEIDRQALEELNRDWSEV